MTKSETASAKREARLIKSALNSRQKLTAADIKKRRNIIRSTEKEIADIERETAAFVRTSTDRLAILDGRLNS